jgi:hypothetical protein
MKTIRKITLLVFALCSLTLAQNSFADSSNPPDPPGEHGEQTDQSGGSAPIGGGLFVLLGLGAAYGGKKLYDYKKTEAVEESLSGK